MHPAAQQIINFYKKLEKDEMYSWVKWVKKRKRFTRDRANKFFVGVMLDQGQLAERAWEAGEYLVDNYFRKGNNFWEQILDEHHAKIKSICKTGFNGKAFALGFKVNKFPMWLRYAAKKILDEYNSDVRNIWNIASVEAVDTIYDNFIDFKGIGDGLAKMAQFILVREYGVAGGYDNRSKMKAKPDILLRRVTYRTGISQSEKTKDVISSIDNLGLESQADFDAAAWTIGREFCFKTGSDCGQCPIEKSCEKAGI